MTLERGGGSVAVILVSREHSLMSSPAATIVAPANPRSRVILASLIGTSIE